MSTLGQILEREIDLISRFVVCLEEEQKALRAATPELLAPINEEKSALAEQLNIQESERIKQVAGPSNLTDRERMQAWLNAHPAETSSASQWSRLLDLAKKAKQISELNATLVKLHLERTAQALAILNRHSQENTLYGSNGQASTYTGSRIVDSA